MASLLLEGCWHGGGSTGDAAQGHRRGILWPAANSSHPVCDLTKRIPIKITHLIPATKKQLGRKKKAAQRLLNCSCLSNNTYKRIVFSMLVDSGTPTKGKSPIGRRLNKQPTGRSGPYMSKPTWRNLADLIKAYVASSIQGREPSAIL